MVTKRNVRDCRPRCTQLPFCDAFQHGPCMANEATQKLEAMCDIPDAKAKFPMPASPHPAAKLLALSVRQPQPIVDKSLQNDGNTGLG